MKLGVSYIVFDGIELLEHSILQIRPYTDYISVIYQNSSWFGTPMRKTDLAVLENLRSSKIIDELVPFTKFVSIKEKSPAGIMKAKEYEKAKRQFGLELCLKRGCTHYLCMDVDEFYISEEFKRAKEEIIQKGYDSTAVRFINYVNLPTLHRGFDPNRVPFICKISNGSKMTRSFFVKCDPTRGVSNGSKKVHEFLTSTIVMHHMETVRKDLFLKYDSTTRLVFRRDKTQELVASIKTATEKNNIVDFKKIIFPGLKSRALTKSKNLFNIPYESWIKK